MDSRKKLYRLIICSLFLWLIGTSLPFSARPAAGATNERIADVAVEIEDGKILVTANLIRGFSQATEEDIKNGIPKDLFYYILLKKRQTLWFDEEILSQTVKYTVKYNLLKKQYLIFKRTGGQVQREVTDSFDGMSRLISTIKNVKIAEIKMLNSQDTYYISVKAEMKASKLPYYLDYLLFFIPFLEVDTPWASSGPLYRK